MEESLNKGEVIIYSTKEGDTSIDVKLDGETVWLTGEQIVNLFEKAKSTISHHISNVFKEGELDRNSTVRNIEQFYPSLEEKAANLLYLRLKTTPFQMAINE